MRQAELNILLETGNLRQGDQVPSLRSSGSKGGSGVRSRSLASNCSPSRLTRNFRSFCVFSQDEVTSSWGALGGDGSLCSQPEGQPVGTTLTVKGFIIINEAEEMFFLELSCFFYDTADIGNLISDSSAFSKSSSAFSKSSLNIWKFLVHLLLKPSLENFSITLLMCKMSAIVH